MRHVHRRRIAMRRLSIISVAPLLLLACSDVGAPKAGMSIAQAVADPARPASYKAADALRKPAETLAFSGVKPGMIVGEFYPAGGYFTRMISEIGRASCRERV